MELFPDTTLRKSPVLLKTYSGEHLPLVGDMDVRVQYEQQTQNLVLTVVAGEGPSLIGRNWLQYLQLNWREIKAVRNHAVGSLDYLLDKYGDIFTDELGTIKSFCAQLDVKPGEKPKPRTVPYAVRRAIEDEIDRLECEGILEKVTHSEWATPIVAVPKPDGRVCLCSDFKVTLNQSLNIDQYLLPKVEDLFATSAGGKKFTKLDLSQAYLQLELHPESLKYCTINTHKGLSNSSSDSHSIASAPAQFQKVMDTILQGVSGAMCYIDNILVTGATEEEHLRNLEEVLRWLQAHGIRMRRSKCYFTQDSVEYLGHRLDAEGLRATPEKIAVIENAPLPWNVQQLRPFLGLLSYYCKFLPNLAAIVQPLNDLMQKGKKWVWSSKCSQAVKTVPTLPLKLARSRCIAVLPNGDSNVQCSANSDVTNDQPADQESHTAGPHPWQGPVLRSQGMASSCSQDIATYHSKIPELSVEDGCLLWGGRVIIPCSLKEVIMAELQGTHGNLNDEGPGPESCLVGRVRLRSGGTSKVMPSVFGCEANPSQCTSASLDLAELTMATISHRFRGAIYGQVLLHRG